MAKTDRSARTGGSERVQEAYDYCEGQSAFIIADIATDGAWIAVPEGEEASVAACR